MRYYLVNVTITSKGTEDRQFTPYDVLETAQRKYHEALTGIGAGSKSIAVALLDSNLNQVQKEIWRQHYTITYDVNGGSGIVSDVRVEAGDSVYLNDGSSIVAPEGKVFAGWAEDAAATEVLDNPYTPNGDVTLYAIYKDE